MSIKLHLIVMSHLLNRSRQINFQCIARGATLKIEKKKEKKTVICCQQNFKFLKPLCQ